MSLKVFNGAWRTFAILLVMSAVLLCSVAPGEFLRWDDRIHIEMNPWLNSFQWLKFWTQPYYGLYIPLTYTVWTFLYQLSHLGLAFHALNLFFHAVNATLVFCICRRVRPELRAAAPLAALLFFVHPLQLEPVAWISGLRDVLAACLALGAAWLWLSPIGWGRLGLATLMFVASLLAKPSGLTVPLALLVASWGAVRVLVRPRKLLVLLVWSLLGVALALFTHVIQESDLNLRLGSSSVFDRMVISGDALGFYLGKLFLPLHLTSDYGRTPQVAMAWSENGWNLLLVAVTVAGVILCRHRRWMSGRVFVAMIVLLFPTLGWIPFQAQADNTVADRYFYLAMVPMAIGFGAGLARGGVQRVGTFVIVILFGLMVWRMRDWRTNSDFFTHLLQVQPHSVLALTSLGVEAMNHDDLALAESRLEEALALAPMRATVVANLAQVYWFRHEPEKILNSLFPLVRNSEFLRLNQNEERGMSVFYFQLARAMWSTGNWSGANSYYCQFAHLDPDNEMARQEIRSFLAELVRQGRPFDSCGL